MGRAWKQRGSTQGLFGNIWLDWIHAWQSGNTCICLWSDKVEDSGVWVVFWFTYKELLILVFWIKLVNQNMWEDASYSLSCFTTRIANNITKGQFGIKPWVEFALRGSRFMICRVINENKLYCSFMSCWKGETNKHTWMSTTKIERG